MTSRFLSFSYFVGQALKCLIQVSLARQKMFSWTTIRVYCCLGKWIPELSQSNTSTLIGSWKCSAWEDLKYLSNDQLSLFCVRPSISRKMRWVNMKIGTEKMNDKDNNLDWTMWDVLCHQALQGIAESLNFWALLRPDNGEIHLEASERSIGALPQMTPRVPLEPIFEQSHEQIATNGILMARCN